MTGHERIRYLLDNTSAARVRGEDLRDNLKSDSPTKYEEIKRIALTMEGWWREIRQSAEQETEQRVHD